MTVLQSLVQFGQVFVRNKISHKETGEQVN